MRRYPYVMTALVALGLSAGLSACDDPHTPNTPDNAAEIAQELPGAEVIADVPQDQGVELPPTDAQPETGPETVGDADVSQPEVDAQAETTDDGGNVELPPMPCDPPLAFEVDETSVLPYRLAVLTVTGGTGDYAFELHRWLRCPRQPALWGLRRGRGRGYRRYRHRHRWWLHRKRRGYPQRGRRDDGDAVGAGPSAGCDHVV